MNSFTDKAVIIVIVATTILFAAGIMVSLIQAQTRAKPKQKRKSEYDPYSPDYRTIEQRLTDELEEAQLRYDEARQRYTEYITDKLNNEAQPNVFYLGRDNKILAAMRRTDKSE